ncbi:hypothetical protein ACIRO1_34485 [Streptomyces sp. NPDC102381]|uniref:hypothetical protein n=1 Tax=Streptomyces sp. NPDC102381 TaxID=3366164 RepID=UPI00382C8D27
MQRDHWETSEVFSPETAAELARTVRITQTAQRRYMAAYIVSENTADHEIRLLLTRFLQVGRISRKAGTTVMRARSPKTDGNDAYTFLVDTAAKAVIGFVGPDLSWFSREHVPTENLLQSHKLRLQREQEQQASKQARQAEERQRREAHLQRMAEQESAARARRQAGLPAHITWPVLPADCVYDWDGRSLPEPDARRPIRAEESIRRVARRPGTVFHADALNSPFFRSVPVHERFQALRSVVDKLLRAPTKGTVTVGRDHITVTGQKVALTLTPDCTMVRTLMPSGRAPLNTAQYNAKRWQLPDPRPPRDTHL